MPHQCTNCGRTFADGSKEMLSGCPECGGNKFQFRPEGAVDADAAAGADAAGDPDLGGGAPAGAADQVGAGSENGAQAEARSEVVSEDELADAAADADADRAAAADAADDAAAEESSDPNLDALRQKLNDQFESIRIVNPGQYELNLMELYDREEYIISLREDGRYVIEMPESWGPHDD
ncbi:OapC/ArvC family zinc-ribbon domain-containing protein [Halobaculum sp. D14]|uniref:OapC/ArvC family zinc-ribbon domain-containing protein n=1 Tax=Halobaculum sp. D14 TaxID=3421642 RepID=UPI003EBF57AA